MRNAVTVAPGVLAAAMAMGFTASGVKAQGYDPQPRQIYCASNDPRGGRCRMPWRRSVLSWQMSSTACIEGRTWGSDPYAVWVKGGCRGQFRDARGYPPPPAPPRG